jgi:hypothetical protein
VFAFYRKILPPMSETERDALEAGTTWWDGQLFSGKPEWNDLLRTPPPQLTAEEQSFLDNETEELCAMIDEWQIISTLHDMPPEVWRFIKDKGFFGLIIPKEYGGKQFSAYAHSQIVTKLSTRTCAGAVTVMVPNSLGPRRAADPLRDRRAEAALPAAAGARRGHSVLRADQPAGRVGRRIDSRHRRRLHGSMAGQGNAWPARDMGKTLHHARPGRHGAGTRVPRRRPGPDSRRRAGPRHHMRADPDRSSGRADRPPPQAADRRIHERPQLGHRRLHPDGLRDRRTEDDRRRLEDADELPRRRAARSLCPPTLSG